METYYEEAFRTRGLGITVISTALKQRAAKLGIPHERICHIPGGAFPDLFQARSKEECRNRMGFPLLNPIICFSSADSHFDLEIVMTALAIVARKYPSIKLLITGQTKKSVQSLARTYGVFGNVHLTGYLPLEELPWILGCADLFVLPFPNKVYNVGRWPNKICDYMCVGRPTVTNPVGDIKILFDNHKIGLLADWDPVDFSQKIIFLIENPVIANQFGNEARQVAITKYDWQCLVDKLEDFYSKILNM